MLPSIDIDQGVFRSWYKCVTIPKNLISDYLWNRWVPTMC